jgi:sucrose phosphorylase
MHRQQPPKNQCQLITYPNSLGTTLADLRTVLDRHFRKALGGVHILPFYPSSADRGFAPIDYTQVDAPYGSWSDVEAIARDYDVMADFMLNHISQQSKYFQDFLRHGDASPYADFFIRYSRLAPGGKVSEADLAKIYTRKPRAPYLEVTLADGTKDKVWCTFDYEQIDINLDAPSARQFVKESIQFLCERGLKMLRIDAFAYATKKLGTDCFFLEPQVWELLGFTRELAAPYGVELLPEVHEHHRYQLKIAEHGYWVYDFALPVLTLHALYVGTSKNLRNWLTICPGKQITTLDTHDGLPVVDVVDLMTSEEIELTRDTLYSRGSNVNRRYSTADYQNLDIYQINCTYYSALGDNDDAYLTARAIQFFSPGIPQVYYVGLLAGANDIELVEKTRVGRDINRHNYTLEEIGREVRRPVVQRLLELMEFRNTHPAFDGAMQLLESPDDVLAIRWTNGAHTAELRADLKRYVCEIRCTDGEGSPKTLPW